MNIIYTKTAPFLPYKKGEILRYCGVKQTDLQLEKMLEECLKELDGRIQNRICYCEFDIKQGENEIDLGFLKSNSKLLVKHLKNCDKIILFAATVGIEIDRAINKYSHISPSKAVIFQAIGAERIETLCDYFQESLGDDTLSRVSPGYGDIPLEMQRDIFKVLDIPKRIGVSLNESMLMSPSKSVTAIIGISKPIGD